MRSRAGCIERGKRLIEQQQTGLRRQRAHQRHALQLAAGKLPRIAVRQLAQFEARQQIVDSPAARAVGHIPRAQ